MDMGSPSDTHPPQLTVDNSGNVTFNTTTVAPGFWTTQIKISDGLSYVVVDFILFVTVCIALLHSVFASCCILTPLLGSPC